MADTLQPMPGATQPGGTPTVPSGTERQNFDPSAVQPGGMQPTGLPQFVLLVGSRLPNDGSSVVGSSSFLRHQETSTDGVTQFGVINAAVSITQPDGTVWSGAAPVQVLPDGAALTQELRAVWVPVQGGPHRVTWTFQALGTEVRRVETYFVSWTDVGSVVRRRLRETSTSLADMDIDAEIAVTVQQLIDRFVLLQQANGYTGLTGLDQERFDTAAAYLTAISMRFYRMKTTPIGELSEVKLNQNSFKFAVQQQKGEVSIEEQWLQEALVSLGRVSLIQQTYASAAASFSPFTVTGPTRYAEQMGNVETLMSGIIRLLTDRWNVGWEDGNWYWNGDNQI